MVIANNAPSSRTRPAPANRLGPDASERSAGATATTPSASPTHHMLQRDP